MNRSRSPSPRYKSKGFLDVFRSDPFTQVVLDKPFQIKAKLEDAELIESKTLYELKPLYVRAKLTEKAWVDPRLIEWAIQNYEKYSEFNNLSGSQLIKEIFEKFNQTNDIDMILLNYYIIQELLKNPDIQLDQEQTQILEQFKSDIVKTETKTPQNPLKIEYHFIEPEDGRYLFKKSDFEIAKDRITIKLGSREVETVYLGSHEDEFIFRNRDQQIRVIVTQFRPDHVCTIDQDFKRYFIREIKINREYSSKDWGFLVNTFGNRFGNTSRIIKENTKRFDHLKEFPDVKMSISMVDKQVTRKYKCPIRSQSISSGYGVKDRVDFIPRIPLPFTMSGKSIVKVDIDAHDNTYQYLMRNWSLNENRRYKWSTRPGTEIAYFSVPDNCGQKPLDKREVVASCEEDSSGVCQTLEITLEKVAFLVGTPELISYELNLNK